MTEKNEITTIDLFSITLGLYKVDQKVLKVIDISNFEILSRSSLFQYGVTVSFSFLSSCVIVRHMCPDKAPAHTLTETTLHPSEPEVLLYKHMSRLEMGALILCPGAKRRLQLWDRTREAISPEGHTWVQV